MPATPIHRFTNTPTNPFGPAPSSSEPHLARPKSASSLPYARPPYPKDSSSTASSINCMQTHPIMVALSGWPEPVYVAESKEVARRRSRAGTPVLQPLTTGMGDGVGLSMLPPINGGGSKHSNMYETSNSRYREREREESSPYPVSSTRSTRTSPVNSDPNSPTLQHQHQHQHHSYPHPPLPKGYHDPRYGPGATLHDKALRVAPAWSSSSSRAVGDSSSTVQAGLGMRVPAGQRGEGVMVMRAVPDVYPPPGRVIAGAGGVAKEVYPRDPNNAFLWNGAGGGGSTVGGDTPMSAGIMSPPRHDGIKEER